MEAFFQSSLNSSGLTRAMQYSTATSLLLKTEADIERVISQKCKFHPLLNADLLHLKLNAQNPRICISCVQQNDIQTKDYLQIKSVLNGSSSSDLFTFPVLNDPGLRQELSPQFKVLDTYKSQIDFFYQELLQQVQAKIEARRQTKLPQILQLGEIYQASMESWSKILDIDNLKMILYEQNNESKLISFINDHIANSERNTKTLKGLCDQFKSIQSQFSMQNPNQIKNMISSLIEDLNFFKANNPSSPLSTGQVKKTQHKISNAGMKRMRYSIILLFSDFQSGQSRNQLQLKQQEVYKLQHELKDCRSQIQEQQLLIEQLLSQGDHQSKQISELMQKLQVSIVLLL